MRSTAYFVCALGWILIIASEETQETGEHLLCHNCIGSRCERNIENNAGRCSPRSREGKCYIRVDPNGEKYWGCANAKSFPGLKLDRIGCNVYEAYGWGKTPVIWCLCGTESCNTRIHHLIDEFPNEDTRNVTARMRHLETRRRRFPPNFHLSMFGLNPAYFRGVHKGQRDRLTESAAAGGAKQGAKQANNLNEEPINSDDSVKLTKGFGLYRMPIPRLHDCRIHNGYCDHNCMMSWNGLGYCSCRAGYSLGNDHMTCEDNNECLLDNGGCLHDCANTPGSYHCQCFTGHDMMEDHKSCKEVDECAVENGGCSHDCHNLPGSFTCLCPVGYELDTDDKTCIDINECMVGLAHCEGDCTNILGSFSCACPTGHALMEDNSSCQDIDECSTANGGCDQVCRNTVGSHECSCLSGFLMSPKDSQCMEIDECADSNGGCAQQCTNTNGSYTCSCGIGYSLQPDGLDCLETVRGDHCVKDNGGCDHICHSVDEANVACECRSGFFLLGDNKRCQDMDECQEGVASCQQVCVNTPGSFECTCTTGYGLESDGSVCSEINECDVNNGGCDDICINTHASYFCTCSFGFMLHPDGKQCIDVNECSINNGGCEQLCNNTVSAHHCYCEPGFSLNEDGISCSDRDECAGGGHGCNGGCVNKIGSYECTCQNKYTLGEDGHSCVDYDECSVSSGGCAQGCVNTEGSHYCTCDDGFQINVDGVSCDDFDECSLGLHNCTIKCVNLPGSYKCACDSGYVVGEDKSSCHDDNECENDNGGCSHRCFNTEGSFRCVCRDSDMYALGADRKTCLVKCPSGFEYAASIGACYSVHGDVAKSHQEAEVFCQARSRYAHLVTLDSEEKREYLGRKVSALSDLLDGWRGWWTAGVYKDLEFMWPTTESLILKDGPHWLRQKRPYDDTCIWGLVNNNILSLGNEDCSEPSGFICEVQMPAQ